MAQYVRLLTNRQRLSRQRRLVYLQAAAVQQAEVRWHLVARGKNYDITRDQCLRIDALSLA